MDETQLDIRYTLETDKIALSKWLKWPKMLNAYPAQKKDEVRLMVENWIGFHRLKSSLTATYKSKPVGIATLFLMPYKKTRHNAMLYFIVDPQMQRRGIGKSLMRNIQHLGKNYFRLEGIHAEIFGECPGFHLLRSLGFNEVFRQEDYIVCQSESLPRIMMERRLHDAQF